MECQQQETGAPLAVEYAGWIKGVASYLTRGITAEFDNVQQVLRKSIWKHSGMDTYLLKRTARCDAIDYLRSRKVSHSFRGKFPHISMAALDDLGIKVDTEYNAYYSARGFPPYIDRSPERRTDEDIEAHIIMAQCSPEDQQLLYNQFWLGRTQKEEGERLGKKTSAISMRRSRPMKQLRRKYASERTG